MATNKELEARLNDLARENEQLRELVEEQVAVRDEHAAAGNNTVPSLKQLYDPYESHNPLHIKSDIEPDAKFPEGQKLSWKSDRIRQYKGWRGWIPVRWDDEYGKNLGDYLGDAPMRMEGSENLDGYVRRGGLILCRLDKRIWNSRNAKRELKDMQQRGVAGANTIHFDRQGVQIDGEGMSEDQRPRHTGARPLAEGASRSELMPDRRHLSQIEQSSGEG